MFLYCNNSLIILFCWIFFLFYIVRILFVLLDVSKINVFIIWSKLVVMGVDFGSYICLYIGYLDFVYVFINIIVI